MALDDDVYLDNDYVFRASLTKIDEHNEEVPDVGLLTVSGYFAAAKGGTAIGSTQTTLDELTFEGGTYLGIADRATLASVLSAYADTGTPIYRVIDVAGDSRLTTAVLVKSVRE